jgi:hypothetical protein
MINEKVLSTGEIIEALCDGQEIISRNANFKIQDVETRLVLKKQGAHILDQRGDVRTFKSISRSSWFLHTKIEVTLQQALTHLFDTGNGFRRVRNAGGTRVWYKWVTGPDEFEYRTQTLNSDCPGLNFTTEDAEAKNYVLLKRCKE